MSDPDYSTVTELTGTRVTREALSMLCTRYAVAATFCEGQRVLEVACGTGQGLGYLKRRARSVVGSDCTESLLRRARDHYGERVPLVRLDAHRLPFTDASFDVVLLYEAIYYLARPDEFLEECRRVLARPGTVLLATVNPAWSGFNPSPLSTRYFSADGLRELLGQRGFEPELYGAFPAASASATGRVVGAIRRVAVAMKLIPRTMRGKELLKRAFLGPLVAFPPEVPDGANGAARPVPIGTADGVPTFKVLYAVGHVT